jgi:hypothetical protein
MPDVVNEMTWVDATEFEAALSQLVGLDLREIVHEPEYGVLIFFFGEGSAQHTIDRFSLTPWGTWHILYRAQSVGGYLAGRDHDNLLSDHVEHIAKRVVKSVHFWAERGHIYLEFDNGYWLGLFNTEKYLGYEFLIQPAGIYEATTYKVRDNEITRSVLLA